MAVCTTPACIAAAGGLLKAMSPDYQQLDPCEDFYEYSCGGFDASHEVSDNHPVASTMHDMQRSVLELIRDISDSSYADSRTSTDAESENLVKLQDAYQACSNQMAIREQGHKPLWALMVALQEAYGMEDFDLTAGIEFLLNLDQDALINPEVVLLPGIDEFQPGLILRTSKFGAFTKDDTRMITHSKDIDLATSSFGISDELIGQLVNSDGAQEGYADAIRQVFGGLISKVRRGHPEKLNTSRLFEFERQLGNLSSASLEPGRISPLTLDQAKKLLPEISLDTIIRHKYPKDTSGLIILTDPSGLKSLSNLLKTTSPHVLRLYMQWRLIVAFHSYIDSEMVEPLRQYRETNVVGPTSERWETCVSHVMSGLPGIVSYEYLKSSFSSSKQDFGTQIVDNLRKSLAQNVNSTDWMTKDVREQALYKLMNIPSDVGYPTRPNVTNADEIRDDYSVVDVNSTSYFSNQVTFKKFFVAQQWGRLQYPSQWPLPLTPEAVNAGYLRTGKVAFPAAIMQPPFLYSSDSPSYLSYAGFGYVVGHELAHALQDSLLNAWGKLSPWWDNATETAFAPVKNCLARQYGKIDASDSAESSIYLPGEMWGSENVADAGGIMAAYDAWKNEEAQNPSPLLPRLDNFTQAQLFFVSHAHVMCGESSPKFTMKNSNASDPHPPTSVRVKGGMANSREFREAFNCPVKEPTCEVW